MITKPVVFKKVVLRKQFFQEVILGLEKFVPYNAILAESGDPLLTEDGKYILF